MENKAEDEVALRIDDSEGKRLRFATAVIRLYVNDSVDEIDLRRFLRGIGEDLRSFPGYVSRKIVELPDGNGRVLIPLLKFSGATAEEAYANLMRWNESEELSKWMRVSAEIGLINQGRDNTKSSVGHISLSQRDDHPTVGSSFHVKPSPVPPKHKMCVLIEFWVFILVSLHAAAGTTPSIQKVVQNEPFTLLIVLSLVVPILVYCGLPLILSIPPISRWVHARITRSPPERPTSCLEDFFIILEDGFGLFNVDTTTEKELQQVKRKTEALERRLDAIGQRQTSALNLDGTQQPITEVIKDEHRVAGIQDNTLNEEDLATCTDDTEGGVSVAARHYVRWGCKSQFSLWAEKMSDAMRDFPGGGFLGSDVFREENNERQVYVTLFRFATLRQMTLWLDSETRAEHLLRLQPYVESTSDYATLGSGLRLVAAPLDSHCSTRAQRNFLGELLFHESDSLEPPAPPALYKTCILITLGLFLVAWVISAHLGRPLENGLPHALLATFISTSVTVIGNSYIGAPLMTFFFSKWLRSTPNTPENRPPNPLARFLVLGTSSHLLQATILLLYMAILVLAAVLKA